MQDSDYVHKRDIATILTQLQDNIEETKKELENKELNSQTAEIQINKLINDVDRDLKLKAHALVRNKLSKSKMMPLRIGNDFSLKRAEDKKSELTIQIPQTDPVIVPQVSTPPLNQSRKSPLSRSLFPSTPTPCIKKINPILTTPFPSKARSSLTTNLTRRRKLPTGARHDLPFVNRHDPQQPPPPIPANAIENYGLNQLCESGLISSDALYSELNDLLVTYPISKEIPVSETAQQTYILDKGDKMETINLVDHITSRQLVSDRNPPNQKHDYRGPIYDDEDDLEGKSPFMLINGRPDNSDPDFSSFKLKNSNLWEKVEIILDLLRLVCQEYGLTKQKIMGSVVIELTQLDPDSVSREKLLRCFVNSNFKRSKKQTKVGFGFIGPNAEHKAAAVIQSIWRGFHARRFVRHIQKTQAARRIIGRFIKKTMTFKKFVDSYKADFKRKMMNFEACQNTPEMLYRHDIPYTIVQFIEGHHGVEIGRLSMLSDENCSLIFFTRKKFLPSHLEYIKKNINDPNRLQIVSAQQRLPKTLPIEDVLASDSRSLKKIRDLSRGTAVHIQPSSIQDSIVEITVKLGGLAIMPNKTKTVMFSTRDAIRRHLKSAKAKLFESSDEIFDKATLCNVLTNLSVTNLAIHQWKIRLSSGSIGWVNTSDFVLLERLRANTDVLTEKDLEDQNFRDLLEQSLSNDLATIIETTGDTSKEDFLKEIWMCGGYIEAAPRQVACSPAVVVYIPPVGQPQIIGTWEYVFQSAYEPFAMILPAFNLNTAKLKKSASRISDMLCEKRMIGYNIIDYWYCARTTYNSIDEEKVKMQLVADDLEFAQFEKILPILLVEQVTGKKFNPETMSFGPGIYAYVQEKLVLPRNIELDVLIQKLRDESLPTEHKISLFQDITDPKAYTLVVVEVNYYLLITLVYRVFSTLIERIFNRAMKPNDPLFYNIFAIEYLKTQVDHNNFHSTALTSKIKNRDWERNIKKNITLVSNQKQINKDIDE